LSKVWWLMPVIPAHSGGEQAGEAWVGGQYQKESLV
jgi:hypothetical protein